MDVESGRLIRDLADVPDWMKSFYKPVPAELQPDAEEELGDVASAVVNLRERSPLADWARSKQRCKRINRHGSREIAKASRKRNR